MAGIEQLEKRMSKMEKSLATLLGKIDGLFEKVRNSKYEESSDEEPNEYDLNEKTYPNTREGSIEEILDNFDFNRMADVMAHLNWVWYKSTTSPTVAELRADAESQLRSAWRYLDDKEFDYYGWRENNTGSGGFDIWVAENESGQRFAELKFVVENWRVEPVETA